MQSIGSITATIAQMSEITLAISGAVEQQGAATREIARNIQSVAAGSSEISDNIGGVTGRGGDRQAASQVLGNARELDTSRNCCATRSTTFWAGSRGVVRLAIWNSERTSA